MNRQYAVIGLGSFGIRVLEKLSEMTDQVIVVDKARETVEKYKDLAAKAFVADALDRDALERIVPAGIDVAIVDVGDNLEVAIVVVNALKRLGARQIVARADSDERGEILAMVGATRIVYPAREAAARLVPMLVSSSLFGFMAISPSLALAEVKVPARYVGSTLVGTDMRKERGINVVAIRKESGDEYAYFDPEYRLAADDVLLCAGAERDVSAFSGALIAERRNVVKGFLRGLLGRPGPKPSDGKGGAHES